MTIHNECRVKRGLFGGLFLFSLLIKILGGDFWRNKMDIKIYDQGQTYEIDSKDIYNPFPERADPEPWPDPDPVPEPPEPTPPQD